MWKLQGKTKKIKEVLLLERRQVGQVGQRINRENFNKMNINPRMVKKDV